MIRDALAVMLVSSGSMLVRLGASWPEPYPQVRDLPDSKVPLAVALATSNFGGLCHVIHGWGTAR